MRKYEISMTVKMTVIDQDEEISDEDARDHTEMMLGQIAGKYVGSTDAFVQDVSFEHVSVRCTETAVTIAE